MSTPANFGWMTGKIVSFLGRVRNQKPVRAAILDLPPQQVPDPLPPSSPTPPAPSDVPQKQLADRHADVERSLRSAHGSTASTASEEGRKDEGNKPFHERMSECATSIAGCLVALAFLLLLKAPTAGFSSALLCTFCYFAMLDLFTGIGIYYIHVARASNRDVARVQAAAAAVGLVAAVMDGLLLCYLFLEAAQFWALALALLTSVVGFCGFAVATGGRDWSRQAVAWTVPWAGAR